MLQKSLTPNDQVMWGSDFNLIYLLCVPNANAVNYPLLIETHLSNPKFQLKLNKHQMI